MSKNHSYLSAAAVGSMPSSATFFITYESLKRVSALSGAKGHMLASSVGECFSCLIRVPTEVSLLVLLWVQVVLLLPVYSMVIDKIGFNGPLTLLVSF